MKEINDDIVELTEKEEIKSIKNFLQQIKDETVDYTIVNDIIKNKFLNINHQIISHNNKQVLCIDADDYLSVYYEILSAMVLSRKRYAKVDSNLSKFLYVTNQGNKRIINIAIKIINVSVLYNTKYKMALEYYFDAGFRFSDEGFDNKRQFDYELVLHQNSKPIILRGTSICNYTAKGNGNRWTETGAIRRTRYSNNLWFDDAYVNEIFEYGENTKLWVIFWGGDIPPAAYLLNKEDVLRACKTTKLIEKSLEKLQSKLVEEDFIIDLNDKMKNLEIRFEDFIEDGTITKEITFYTNHTIEFIDAGVKFITIKQEKDNFIYRFNGIIGQESLTYVRAITTDYDIKQAIEVTINMIQYSESLNIYKTDLLEILNNL